MMLRLEWNLLHFCLPALRAYELVLIQKHKGHMISDTNMAQLNMIGIVDLQPPSAARTRVVISIVVQIPMKAVSFSTGAGCLFCCSIVNEINKIVREKKHVWKICT